MPWWVKGLGFAVLVVVAYRVECWWRPWKPCRCCGGSGKHYRPDRKTFRDCSRCTGTGRKPRLGTRIWRRGT